MRLRTSMAALVIAAMATACTGGADTDGVATATSPGQSSTAAASPNTTSDPLRFAACLRERGVDVADPKPGEQVVLPGKDDKIREALRACARLAPPSQQEERSTDIAASRAYAQCVRGKGFPDFPDPDDRGPRIPKNLIDDERFKAADRDCAQHLNDGKGGAKK